ncbi:hypothetical protein HDU89_004509 [Geranomyces variabilis]|nr:hypothetical protein HDU89_004509 [Geranomyces variabilis]
MSASLSGRRVRDATGQFVAAKEDTERAKEREDEVLDESVQYAGENEEVAAVGDTAFGPEGADQQFAHISGRVPVRVPEREYVDPYDLTPTPARGMLRRGSDASSPMPVSITRRDLLDILKATLEANGVASAERRTVFAPPSGAALGGAHLDGEVRSALRASATGGPGSPPSSASSEKSSSRMQKHFMDKIPSYSGTGGIAKLLDFADAIDNYILQDEEMSAATTLTLALSHLKDVANLWWRKHKPEYSAEDPARIKTWKQLRCALAAQFCPDADVVDMRDRLQTVVQKGSVAAYNAEFLRIALHVDHLDRYTEAHNYMRGLKPEIRNLVKSSLLKPGETTVTSIPVLLLQSTALALGAGKAHTPTTDGLYAGSVGAAARGAALYKKRKDKKLTGARPRKCFACDQEGHQLKDCIIWKETREQAQSRLKANAAEAHIAHLHARGDVRGLAAR